MPIVSPAVTQLDKSGIKQRVLEDLSVVEIGQSAASQDDARIEAAYREVYDELKELGLAVWSISGYLPNKIVPHVVALTAWNAIASGSYGVSPERYQRIQLAAASAEREIRRVVTPKYESTSEPRDY